MTISMAELDWIDAQHERLCALLIEWSNLNSGSHNLPGLARQIEAIERAFAPLGATMQRHALEPQQWINWRGQTVSQPLGEALTLIKRPEAARQVLLTIHMDTVYGVDHPFQQATALPDGKLRGPGVADAKGGLLVMLAALEAFERSAAAVRLGWRVVINPDEELGSPGSRTLLARMAQGCEAGLVYEPALPDGSLITARKGSGNFTLVVRGRSAHAGRDFEMGRNAVTALARIISAMSDLSGTRPGLTVSMAAMRGGGPSNIVPDLAVARLNVRLWHREDEAYVREAFARIIGEAEARDGVQIQLDGDFFAPPKPMDEDTARLRDAISRCAAELEQPVTWRDSGGVCDGNRLAAAGLPTIDTLGVIGGAIHSEQEYVWLDSLIARAKLSAKLLMKLANGELNIKS